MFTVIEKAALHRRFAVTETVEPEYIIGAVESIRDAIIRNGGQTRTIHPTKQGALNQAFQRLVSGEDQPEAVFRILQARRDEVRSRVEQLEAGQSGYVGQLDTLKARGDELRESHQVAVVSFNSEESDRLLLEIGEIEKEISNTTLRLKSAEHGVPELKNTLMAYDYICQRMRDWFAQLRFIQHHNEFIASVGETLCTSLDEYRKALDALGFTPQGSEFLTPEGIDWMQRALSAKVQ